MNQQNNVIVFAHPLISHKIAHLRDATTRPKIFRELISEITMLMTYESTKNLPTVQVEVQTPLEKTMQNVVEEGTIVAVPILRAGLGMLNGVLAIIPTMLVGHIGMARDEATLEPKAYYVNLPQGIEQKQVLVLDPMLATGGSASATISYLKKRGVKNISLMSIIAAPEGVKRMTDDHPDVKIYIAALDRCLNEKGYILPGLGDAGDRLFL